MRDDSESLSGYVYEHERHTARTGEAFDRLAFAMRALALLRPRDLSILVRETRWTLQVSRGRAWIDGTPDWAVVAIPPDATRKDIVIALAGLLEREHEPFLLDLLLRLA